VTLQLLYHLALFKVKVKTYALLFRLARHISVPGVLRVDEAGAIVTPVGYRLRSNGVLSRRAPHKLTSGGEKRQRTINYITSSGLGSEYQHDSG